MVGDAETLLIATLPKAEGVGVTLVEAVVSNLSFLWLPSAFVTWTVRGFPDRVIALNQN